VSLAPAALGTPRGSAAPNRLSDPVRTGGSPPQGLAKSLRERPNRPWGGFSRMNRPLESFLSPMQGTLRCPRGETPRLRRGGRPYGSPDPKCQNILRFRSILGLARAFSPLFVERERSTGRRPPAGGRSGRPSGSPDPKSKIFSDFGVFSD